MIDMFVKVWYDDIKLKKETIIKSLKRNGISTKFDDSDAKEISIPEIIYDEILDPNEYIEQNENIMNDSDISEMNRNNNIRLNKITEKK